MHQLVESFALFAYQVRLRYTDILECDLSRVAGTDAQLPVDLVARHTRGIRRNDDQAEAVVLLLIRVGDALGHHEVADSSIGDEHLVAVDNVIVAVLDCTRFIAGHISPGVGLCIRTGAYPLPAADF